MDNILKFAAENTVSAANQMPQGSFFGDMNAPHPRVLFVGNSITLHEISKPIGWTRLCGMAASSVCKDYVHILMNKWNEEHPGVSWAIAQASEWEQEYWHPEQAYETIALAREWDADIIILRLSENTPVESLVDHDYLQATIDLLKWLNPNGKARYVVTDGFWPNPMKDLTMYKAAQAVNARFVSLTDLGQRDEMKAIGLFEHTGVAAHPGDEGMRAIAERLYCVVKDMLTV